jgi:hypothetical protein
MTTTITTVPATESRSTPARRAVDIWRTGLTAAAVASAANLAIILVARAANTSLLVRFSANPAPSRVTAGAVVVTSVVSLVVGTGVAALADRGAGSRLRAVQIAGAALALVSLGLPLSVHADIATKLVLASMHLVAGAAFVTALQGAKTSRQRTGEPVHPEALSAGRAA